MKESHFTVNHVRLTADRPFAEVTAAFERRLGRFDPEIQKALTKDGDLFTEVSRDIDKWLWFVEAHLQAER